MFSNHLEKALRLAIQEEDEQKVTELVTVIQRSHHARLTALDPSGQDFLSLAFQANNLNIFKILYAQLEENEAFMEKIKQKNRHDLLLFLDILTLERSFDRFLKRQPIASHALALADAPSWIMVPNYYQMSLATGFGIGAIAFVIAIPTLIILCSETLGIFVLPVLFSIIPATIALTMLVAVAVKEITLAIHNTIKAENVVQYQAELKKDHILLDALQLQVQNLLEDATYEKHIDALLLLDKQISALYEPENQVTALASIQKTLTRLQNELMKGNKVDTMIAENSLYSAPETAAL